MGAQAGTVHAPSTSPWGMDTNQVVFWPDVLALLLGFGLVFPTFYFVVAEVQHRQTISVRDLEAMLQSNDAFSHSHLRQPRTHSPLEEWRTSRPNRLGNSSPASCCSFMPRMATLSRIVFCDLAGLESCERLSVEYSDVHFVHFSALPKPRSRITNPPGR